MALKLWASLVAFAPVVASLGAHKPRLVSSQLGLVARADTDIDPATLYPAYNLSVPIDHFHNESKYEPHNSGFFNLRYWFDASHYQAGGPVIVLQSGETSGEDRLPFLQKGIPQQLAQATHGIAVILEHRYYGTSMPMPDLSTENLRFLTTEQALADMAYFAQHVKYKGLEHLDLTAPKTAYIGYGGSYAGAFVAFLRIQYPDIYWGTISSSGVTKAIWDYWEYYEPIRKYGPPACILNIQKFTHIIDNILIGKNDSTLTKKLKATFSLQNVTYDDDFASVLGSPPSAWQSRNWDPAVGSPSFYNFCDRITNNTIVYPATAGLKSAAQDLIAAGGYSNESDSLTNPMLNYIGWINQTQVVPCIKNNQTQDKCFGTHDPAYYAQDDITQDWRSWPYQYCTQWGYLQTGSGVPADQLPLISRLITLEYSSIVCVEAFNITTPPDLDAINKYGGFDAAYERLAFIDGETDPWRPATPHAPQAKPRRDTASQPFMLIQGAVHHWDENGLFPNETTASMPPQAVADTQKLEIQFVQQWLLEWKYRCMNSCKC